MTEPAQEPALKPEELDRLVSICARVPKGQVVFYVDDGRLCIQPPGSAMHQEGKQGRLNQAVGHAAAELLAVRDRLITQARTVPPAAAPRGLREAATSVIREWDAHKLEPETAAATEALIALEAALAAAPVGELREALERAIAEAYGSDRYATAAAEAALAALAAAPVTGDRETAGVEPAMWALSDSDGRWVQGYTDITQAGLQAQVERSDLRTPVWFTPLYATPPSGGGDHAAPEAGAVADWPYDDLAAHALLRGNFNDTAGVLSPKPGHEVSDAEQAAINYLCAEWDYGFCPVALAVTARPAGAEGSAEVPWPKELLDPWKAEAQRLSATRDASDGEGDAKRYRRHADEVDRSPDHAG